MKRKAEITESEWLRALEELAPKPPPGALRAVDIAAKHWRGMSMSLAYRKLAQLEAAGRASRVNVAGRVYWTLK